MQVLIIDDEVNARENLKAMLRNLHIFEFSEADGVRSGCQKIKSINPDLVFLDVRMQDGTGFDLMDHFPKPRFKVVFVTAYDQFALKAFRYHAIDYLLKPIHPDELAQALSKAKNRPAIDEHQILALLNAVKNYSLDRLVLSTQEGIHMVKLDDIIHLQGYKNYTTFFLDQRASITVSRTLGDFEDILPEENFFRSHQSHIINISYVNQFRKVDGGSILMDNGTHIPISRRRRELFIQKIQERAV